MAKRKVNIKFILLFVSVLVIGALSIVGIYYYQIILAPERNFKNANQFMEAGNYEKAVSYYGRAVSKKPNNIVYLNAMEQALLKLIPKSESEANENYNKLLSIQIARTRATKTDPKVWIAAIETLRDRCELYRSEVLWREFTATAEQMDGALLPEEPTRALAKFWKVLGQSERYSTLTAEERQGLDKEFLEVVQLLPTDDRMWLAYFDYLLGKAQAQERGNQQALAVETLRQFDTALVECKKKNPQGITASIALVKRLRDMQLRGDSTLNKADLAAAYQSILDAAPRIIGDRKLTLAAAVAMFSGASFESNMQAMKLIEDHLKQFPGDAVTQQIYLNLARGMSTGIGKELAETVFTQSNLPTSIESLSQQGAREAAADLLYTLTFEEWRKAVDESEKKEKLALVLQSRDKVVKFFNTQSLPLMVEDIEARTSLAQGNANDAAVRFEALLKKNPDPNQELYFYAAFANILRNQPGTALSLVNRGLEKFPNYPPLINLSARLSEGVGKLDDARRALAKLLEINPDDKSAQESLARLSKGLDSQAGNPDEKEFRRLAGVVGIAERSMMKKDYDGAVAVLAKELAVNPNSVLVIQALAQVYYIKNDIPTAQVFLNKALALEPNSKECLRLQLMMSTNDPIDRVLAAVRSMYSDPKDQAVETYLALATTLDQLRKNTAQIPADQIQPEALAQRERCEKLIGPAFDAAMQASPNNVKVLEMAAANSTMMKDYATAQKYAQIIQTSGETGLGLTIQSRILVEQEKFKEAIALLQTARQNGEQSPIMLRQLGMLMQKEGDMEAALELIRESYDRRPTDVITARIYAQFLEQTGDRKKALQILQQVAVMNPEDRDLLLSVIDLESDVGDRTKAFELRKQLYKQNPAMSKNSLALAKMLLDTPGDPNMMVNSAGKRKFTDQELGETNTAKMQQALRLATSANVAEGLEILKFLQETAPNDSVLSLMNARAIKKYKSVKEGEAALRSDIAKIPPERCIGLWISLGAYLDESGNPEGARIAFEEAKKNQDPKTMFANIQIADYWFTRSQWANAREALEGANKAGLVFDSSGWMRLSEICNRLRDYDAAENCLAKAVVAGGTPETLATIEMLRAMNLQGRGELAIVKGDTSQSEKDFNASRAALRRATEILPASPLAWVSLSDFERRMYQRTRDSKYLVASEQAADRVLDISVGYWPGIRNKELVYLEKEKIDDAIAVVDRYLSAAPKNVDARKELIELLVRANNFSRAIDLAQEGSRLNPRDAEWQNMIGNLNLRRNDISGATEAFDAAFIIQPDATQLLASVTQRVRLEKKDWNSVLQILRANSKVVATSIRLQIFLAVALVNSGQREPGLVAMRNSYKIIQDGVAADSVSPDEWNTWYTGLASCFDKNPKEAEAFVATVVGDKPMEYWNYTGIATLYMVQGESGTPEAVKMLEKSAEVAKASGVKDSNQQQAAALLQAGNLLYASKNFSKSMELFEQAIQLIPDNAGALNNAAYLIAKSGTNPARAVELARKSVELNAAGIDDFLDTLGFALLRAGKASEAIEPLQKAIVIGQKPSSMIHLAEVFIELKRQLDAKEFLEKAKKQKPTDEQLEEIKALELKLN